MFENVVGLTPAQAARWTAPAEQCQPILEADGMEAVQSYLVEQGVSIIQAIAITRARLGNGELRAAIDIVTASIARQ